MKRGSGRNREIHAGVRRWDGSIRAPKRGFFLISANLRPSGIRSAVQKATIGTFLEVIL